ncbi:MAG TPA: hypothetical protein VGI43_06715 [Mucilaginibacter sp.]|jgi:hypothetical protein
MLQITVPSTGPSQLTFSIFERLGLPAPPNGVDAEVNDSLVLKFEDEGEAISYANKLEDMSNNTNDKDTPWYRAVGDIIVAIRNDRFIQSY